MLHLKYELIELKNVMINTISNAIEKTIASMLPSLDSESKEDLKELSSSLLVATHEVVNGELVELDSVEIYSQLFQESLQTFKEIEYQLFVDFYSTLLREVSK